MPLVRHCAWLGAPLYVTEYAMRLQRTARIAQVAVRGGLSRQSKTTAQLDINEGSRALGPSRSVVVGATSGWRCGARRAFSAKAADFDYQPLFQYRTNPGEEPTPVRERCFFDGCVKRPCCWNIFQVPPPK